ncbi:MAG: YccF domain-containing protein [Oscillospiraceae bacterium]|nr:YccF domain-containing protein [Oscillospiraceae bacterium]
MKTIANLLWVIFGGLELALAWMVAGLLCCLTVVGIPFGIQCFKLAGFVLWPFGRHVEYDRGGAANFLLNLLWILLLGWELALGALAVGLVWCVTIVGIPIGLQAFKFAKLAILPFGAKVVR